ncbi:MAG: preprotein translocase subunit YajC [Candidatus Zixiibacteriota bacterium]
MDTPLILLMANPDAAAGGGGGFLATWGILIPLFLIMYLMLIRPQRKKQKEHEKLLTELKKGDRVVTNSGMFGTIFAIQDDKNKVVLKLTDEVKVEFLKSAIAGKVD